MSFEILTRFTMHMSTTETIVIAAIVCVFAYVIIATIRPRD